MNIWKPAHKRTKKRSNNQNDSNVNDTALVLPDVIAGISYEDTEHEINPSSERTMIGYSSYYPECQERRSRRREPRSHQAFTPKGLGASPSSAFPPPQDLGVVPAPPQGESSRRSDPTSSWPFQASSYAENNWTQTLPGPSQLNDSNAVVNETGYNTISANFSASHGEVTYGARIRSVSSEPHGNSRNCDRRVRCSSASRNKQPRPRPNNSEYATTTTTSSHRPLAANSFPTPPVSPPVQIIEYQQQNCPTDNVEGQNRKAALSCGITNQEYAREERDPGNDNSNHSDVNLLGESHGYQVTDLEALLTHASPSEPANLPMVLASATRLHNMRRSQENSSASSQLPVRPILPLGIIVNAVFKTRDWLFVRTAHGAEGYVPYRVCLPLGILPSRRSSDVQNLGSPWELRGTETGVNSAASQMRIPKQKPTQQTHTSTSNSVGSNNASTGLISTHPRGRPRGRRRANAENTNQTDLQKLQPHSSRNQSETQPPRETLDPPNNSGTNL
ncbi:UNVERIFIED_CONTAM: hypothetical protein RMT77_004885 [Armadillidium vulgare]|nr:hypothetical protein Avbf_02648 [Armadillidium vulgare]